MWFYKCWVVNLFAWFCLAGNASRPSTAVIWRRGNICSHIRWNDYIEFFGGKIINWFGTGKTFLFSMVTTTLAVLCYWKFPAFSLLCLAAFPLGLGLGALNMTSNHFLSLNYKPTHMNWMHGFWGIGATVGPLIMSYYIAHGNAWQRGYLFIAMIYLTLAVVLFFSLPFFRQIEKRVSGVREKR